MPKGYYLHYHDLNDKNRKLTGIDRKVEFQIEAFNNAGLNCELIFCEQPESTLKIIKSCLPGMPDGISWPDPDHMEEPDYLYIRRSRFASSQFIDFLKRFRIRYPDTLIILEIPTYPYDPEMKNLRMLAAFIKDKRYRNHYKEYIDCIADLSGTETIFGIPTVQFRNGLDVNRATKRIPIENHDVIRIMSAAFYEDWHAIDRLLIGLNRYYSTGGNRKIEVYLAGGGSKLPYLKRLAKRLDLEDVVFFPGVLDAEELDELYNKCTLAIECLGLYRKKMNLTPSIKAREYLAKGIPFINEGSIDIVSDENRKFIHTIPSDDSPVDIEKLIRFHNEIYNNYSQENVIQCIRNSSIDLIDINNTMREVIELIKVHAGV